MAAAADESSGGCYTALASNYRRVTSRVHLTSPLVRNFDFVDHESKCFEWAENPFAAEVLSMNPERTLGKMVEREGIEPSTPAL